MDGPYGLPKFWIWSLSIQKYTDDPGGLHFVMCLVFTPQPCRKSHGWSLWFARCNTFSP
ncbi:hypothetical protein Hanom_Chr16g01466521 [Helianthus anomalus]